MAPLINALAQHADIFKSLVCVTGQHREMLDQVLDLFEIVPDYDLDIMKKGQDLFDVTCKVLHGLKPILQKEKPNIVLVHGDTTTTMAASLAAFYCKIPVGHVEAGLRTGNKHAPFPEEINRRITSVLADLHFAPTETARQNLLREGVAADAIHVTGNTVIDALLMAVGKIRSENLGNSIALDLIQRFPTLSKVLSKCEFPDESHRLILVTGHRRENFGKGFENICYALKEIAERHQDVEIVYPVHLNPNVQEPVRRILSNNRRIHLIDPLDYLPFVYLMYCSYLILTDSGGVQEEAPSLGKPVLVMRESTERPEAVEAGTVLLVGTDIEKVVRETSNLLNNHIVYQEMVHKHNPYGAGNTAIQIVSCLTDMKLSNSLNSILH